MFLGVIEDCGGVYEDFMKPAKKKKLFNRMKAGDSYR
jgi:hypothetical protein